MRHAGEPRAPRVKPEIQHPEPPGDEQDPRLARDREAGRLEQSPELSGRERFLHPVPVEPHLVHEVDHERAEKGIQLVRDPDDRDAARGQS